MRKWLLIFFTLIWSTLGLCQPGDGDLSIRLQSCSGEAWDNAQLEKYSVISYGYNHKKQTWRSVTVHKSDSIQEEWIRCGWLPIDSVLISFDGYTTTLILEGMPRHYADNIYLDSVQICQMNNSLKIPRNIWDSHYKTPDTINIKQYIWKQPKTPMTKEVIDDSVRGHPINHICPCVQTLGFTGECYEIPKNTTYTYDNGKHTVVSYYYDTTLTSVQSIQYLPITENDDVKWTALIFDETGKLIVKSRNKNEYRITKTHMWWIFWKRRKHGPRVKDPWR